MSKRWDEYDAAVVFLAGCNFSCPHCFVPELVNDAESISRIEIPRAFEILFTRAQTNRVVITGGEPLVQGYKLNEFLETLKNGGFKVKLETNGSEPQVLEELIREELVDFVTLDIKHKLLDSAYEDVTGVAGMATAVRQSIRILRKSRLPFEFSFTVVPWIHRTEDVLYVGHSLRGSQRLVLQSFVQTEQHVADEFLKCPIPSPDWLQSMAQSLLAHFPEIKVVHPQKTWRVQVEQPLLQE